VQGKPVEIINGKEIILEVERINADFDPRKGGKIIGTIKNKINSMYDNGEISQKEEALALVVRLYRHYG
ncbi:MAG TPA: hypothetical protein PK263_05805, partial [bacterium]|nr:hypothetical protein [bacterium]